MIAAILTAMCSFAWTIILWLKFMRVSIGALKGFFRGFRSFGGIFRWFVSVGWFGCLLIDTSAQKAAIFSILSYTHVILKKLISILIIFFLKKRIIVQNGCADFKATFQFMFWFLSMFFMIAWVNQFQFANLNFLLLKRLLQDLKIKFSLLICFFLQ